MMDIEEKYARETLEAVNEVAKVMQETLEVFDEHIKRFREGLMARGLALEVEIQSRLEETKRKHLEATSYFSGEAPKAPPARLPGPIKGFVVDGKLPVDQGQPEAADPFTHVMNEAEKLVGGDHND